MGVLHYYPKIIISYAIVRYAKTFKPEIDESLAHNPLCNYSNEP